MMPSIANEAAMPLDTSSLDLTLRALNPILSHRDVTELCINGPGNAFINTKQGWTPQTLPFADFDWCRRLAMLVGNSTRQRVDESSPLLSASLPGGERIQIVLPPATVLGHAVMAIRRPAAEAWSLADLARGGLFRATRAASDALDDTEVELKRLLAASAHEEFLRLAVRAGKNIVVSGPTGCGKTTLTKALIREIPASERLICIEDALELVLDRHPNHVRLLYSKGDQGLARVTPAQLLEGCFRLTPNRIILAELRAAEAFEYLRNIAAHPGSITSIHAASAELAFEQLVLLVRQSPAGAALASADVKRLLYLLVDVVVQFGVERHERFIKEVWYDPARKRRCSLAHAA